MENIEKQIQELERELKKTNNKREYIRIKAIILKLKGNSAKSISQKLDVGKSTVFAWIKSYREDSVEALKNKKRPGN